MKPPTFKEWFEENKESEILKSDYAEYKYESKTYADGYYMTFRQWMKEQYNWLIENQEL